MSIKSPTTYGDYYWRQQVEAQAEFDEQIEELFAPHWQSILGGIPHLDLLPVGIQTLLHSMSKPPSSGLGGFALGVGVETIDESLRVALAPIMAKLKREYNTRSLETWLTSTEANILMHRKAIPIEFRDEILKSEGYEPVLHNFLYRSQEPYPSISDLVLYSRYNGDPDNIWSTLYDFYDIDPNTFKVWDWLGRQRLTTEQTQTLYKRGALSESDFYSELARIGWFSMDRGLMRELAYSLPNSMLLVQGELMHETEIEKILDLISMGDIHPDYAQTYLDAVLTKPSTQDIIAYELRQDNALANLDSQLRKVGVHPAFLDVYKTLALPIPPIADIITMAVREAFTPSIAAQFGQYEDYPSELTEWGKRKGLTEEWTQRYWAAHWSLPSPQQGFEMLHRGIIDNTTLNNLLRALDVMPFWRDKLTQIAFRPLTRVDVRRMYKEGVLDEKGVYDAYKQHGYSDDNAERMTEFTIKQTLASLSKFTSGDIVKAFSKRMIDRGTATSLLRDIGIRSEDASYIIGTAEYKREWEFVDDQIAGIRNLYKKRVYDENQARDNLAKLNLPADQINVLMQQWYYEKAEALDATWTTAQTIKFLKRELITQDRARQELNLLGYNDERANMYIKDALWTPEKESSTQ